MANRVDDRLSRREQQRLQAGRGTITNPHDLDWHTVLGFHIGRDLLERGTERTLGVVSPFAFEQPAAQLALLHPRQPHYLPRIVGAPLHERQCLQHGIM
jgi:hypothetical protein